jgi:glycine cleavage system aminomethyltransferase T
MADDERRRRLVSLHAPSAVLWHGESVLRGTERVGHVMSASIAPTLGGSVALAWVHDPLDGEDWCVEIGGEAFPCVISRDPFYDPRGKRLRS